MAAARRVRASQARDQRWPAFLVCGKCAKAPVASQILVPNLNEAENISGSCASFSPIPAEPPVPTHPSRIVAPCRAVQSDHLPHSEPTRRPRALGTRQGRVMANRGVGGGRCRLSLAGRGLGVLFLIASQGCGDPRAVVAERAIDLGSRFQAASLLVASADGFNRPVRFRRYRAALEVTETGQALALSRTGALVVPIDPYVGNGTLRFDFRLDQPDESGTVSLRASLIDPDGYRRSLALLPSPSAKWAAANLSLGEGPNDYQLSCSRRCSAMGPRASDFADLSCD